MYNSYFGVSIFMIMSIITICDCVLLLEGMDQRQNEVSAAKIAVHVLSGPLSLIQDTGGG